MPKYFLLQVWIKEIIDGNKNPKDKATIITQFKFNFINNNFYSYDFKVIPCKISSVTYKNDYCPTPAKGESKTNILNKLNKLSPDAGFKIEAKFYNIKPNFQ